MAKKNFDVSHNITRRQGSTNITTPWQRNIKKHLQKKSSKFICLIKTQTETEDLQNVHPRAVHTCWCSRASRQPEQGAPKGLGAASQWQAANSWAEWFQKVVLDHTSLTNLFTRHNQRWHPTFIGAPSFYNLLCMNCQPRPECPVNNCSTWSNLALLLRRFCLVKE